jgi:hypothetical protein
MNIRYVIDRLFYTEIGQIIVSAIFGMALALVFNRVCKDNCTLYFAPKYNEVNDNIFKIEDTCYKYKTVNVKCNDKAIGQYDGNNAPSNQIKEKSIFDKIFA